MEGRRKKRGRVASEERLSERKGGKGERKEKREKMRKRKKN